MSATGIVTDGPCPDLAEYDPILVNSSAGKDSQACLNVTAEDARACGVLDWLVVVHANLGSAEWPGTKELAAEHAAHYSLPFHVAAREKNGQVETILNHVEQRGMLPDNARRWCTVNCTNSSSSIISRSSQGQAGSGLLPLAAVMAPVVTMTRYGAEPGTGRHGHRGAGLPR